MSITGLESNHRALQPPQSRPDQDLEKLRSAAKELEANFLAEMLKASGMYDAENSFSGGAGEEQFSSFLRLEHARNIVQTQSLGMAEQIFQSLKDRALDRT